MPRREEYLGQVKGKGGVFKVTWGLQTAVRRQPRLQLAAGRGQHRRPRHRPGDARASSRWSRSSSSTTSGRRTCRSATSWRRCAGARTTPSLRRWSSASPTAATSRAARSTTRRPARRSSRTPGPPRGLPRHGARRQRPAAHRHPLRGPGHLPRAQAPLPPDLQQGAEPGPELHDPVRQGEGGARGHRPHGRDLRRDGAARAAWRRRRSRSATA